MAVSLLPASKIMKCLVTLVLQPLILTFKLRIGLQLDCDSYLLHSVRFSVIWLVKFRSFA